jgi:nitroimidazol reductase NimA-like FMN-containing flavoprotein (pyridoxamine 5'-phosphate oxidase superfamily)
MIFFIFISPITVKKMNLLQKDNRVCVEIEKYQPNLSEYSFVVLSGTLEVVGDPLERAKVIRKMAVEAKRKLSENLLHAHGFKKDEGWSALTAKKPLVIVKLKNVTQEIGLKSP